MKDTRIIISDRAVKTYSGPMTVILIDESGNLPALTDKKHKKEIKTLFTIGDFRGKKAQCVTLYENSTELKGQDRFKRILLVGVGPTLDISKNALKDNLRCAGGAVATMAEKIKINEMMVLLPDYLKVPEYFGTEQVLEGILLGDYRFKKYKKKEKEKDWTAGLKKIVVAVKKNTAAVRRLAKKAKLSSSAALTARDMANEPGNKWTPQSFADFAKKLSAKSSLSCKIFNKDQIAKEGMGGIIAVNQGSAVPPKLVILEHTPANYSKTILLVGKGLTFDSGGISLKPAGGMQDMKYDMCGGAAVLSTMLAVAEEKPGVRVVTIVPATENLSGAKAVKPGDIIRHYNGITSEVINTDAEGRLILADALAYGVKEYKPDCVIDLATLTGAVVIALGHHRTGLISNNDKLAELISVYGDQCGEPLWRLPLDEEYIKQIDSKVADIKNIGGREAGTITAGAYLHKFVGDIPWAHLDIAGTAWDFTKKEYVPKGPSGTGVRTLISFIRNWKSLKLK